jgi:hypothetical protein
MAPARDVQPPRGNRPLECDGMFTGRLDEGTKRLELRVIEAGTAMTEVGLAEPRRRFGAIGRWRVRNGQATHNDHSGRW